MSNTSYLLKIIIIVSLASEYSSQKMYGGMKAELLEPFSFDFSAHKPPLAYNTFETSVELFSKLKLIPAIPDKQGAVFLKKVYLSLFSPFL